MSVDTSVDGVDGVEGVSSVCRDSVESVEPGLKLLDWTNAARTNHMQDTAHGGGPAGPRARPQRRRTAGRLHAWPKMAAVTYSMTRYVRTYTYRYLLAPVHILRKSVHEMNSKPSKQIKEQFLDFANLRYE